MVPVPGPSQPTLNEIVDSTRHNLCIEGRHYRCADCGGSCSASSPNVRNWLRSACEPLPFDDSMSHVKVPFWYTVQIANCVPHSSHDLFSYRGIFYCSACGAFSSKRCRLLNSECSYHMSVYCAKAHMKLRAGELLVPTMRWPLPPKFGVMQPATTYVQDDPANLDPFDAVWPEGQDCASDLDSRVCPPKSCLATNSHFDSPEYQMSPPDSDDDSTFKPFVLLRPA